MIKPQPFKLALFAVLALCCLSACGNSYHRVAAAPIAYDNSAYASALCVDQQGIRVPDNYCPIDDGVMGNGGYGWRYHPYLASDPYQDVVYVGYPVGTTYVTTRPARVSTLHIDRGRFPTTAPVGVRASSVRVSSLPTVQSSTSSGVTRGGFGVSTGTPIVTGAGKSFASPAPLPKAPNYAARTSGGSSSSSGGWFSSRSKSTSTPTVSAPKTSLGRSSGGSFGSSSRTTTKTGK